MIPNLRLWGRGEQLLIKGTACQFQSLIEAHNQQRISAIVSLRTGIGGSCLSGGGEISAPTVHDKGSGNLHTGMQMNACKIL